MSAIAVVIAMRNAAPYLPRLLASLQGQTFRDFSAIFVDDASTDNSVACVENQQDSRFTVVRLPTRQGSGFARNTGLALVDAETVCIADADDALPPHSLAVRHAAYTKTGAAVCGCHAQIATTGRIIKQHPPPSGLPPVFCPYEEAYRIGTTSLMSFHWNWLFPTALVRREKARYAEDFQVHEDFVFLARLFFHIHRMVWLPDIVYHWMTRPASVSSSTFDVPRYGNFISAGTLFWEEAHKRGHTHLGDMEYGGMVHLNLEKLEPQTRAGEITQDEARGLIRQMAAPALQHGMFDRCLRPEVFYRKPCWGLALLWHVLQDEGNKEGQQEGQSVEDQLAEAFARELELRKDQVCALTIKQGWLRDVTIDKCNPRKGFVRCRFLFCNTPPQESLTCGVCDTASVLEPLCTKNRYVRTIEGHEVYQRILWLPVPAPDQNEVAEPPRLTLRLGPNYLVFSLAPGEMEGLFAPKRPEEDLFPPEVAALRKEALSPEMQARYRGAWMCMDHPFHAGDNAVSFYRWLAENQPQERAFFVLHRNSPHWEGLERQGVRLVAFGSREHALLYLLAGHFVSSQAQAADYFTLPAAFFGDLVRWDCTLVAAFLPDCGQVLQKTTGFGLDFAAITTKAEWEALVPDGTPYCLTPKEARRTGLPRHDFLAHHRGTAPARRTILLLPHACYPAKAANYAPKGGWSDAGKVPQVPKASLLSEEAARWWRELLRSEALGSITKAHGYALVVYLPDADLLDVLHPPDSISVETGASGLDLLVRAAVLITDNPARALDMAFLQRPFWYSGWHCGQRREPETVPGLVNTMHRDMECEPSLWPDHFCPAFTGLEDLLGQLDLCLGRGCIPDPALAQRAAEAFDLHDGGCCERLFKAIAAV